MQNNDNQTNQKDPQNRGQNGFEYISPGLCSIWLGVVDVFQNTCAASSESTRASSPFIDLTNWFSKSIL